MNTERAINIKTSRNSIDPVPAILDTNRDYHPTESLQKHEDLFSPVHFPKIKKKNLTLCPNLVKSNLQTPRQRPKQNKLLTIARDRRNFRDHPNEDLKEFNTAEQMSRNHMAEQMSMNTNSFDKSMKDDVSP